MSAPGFLNRLTKRSRNRRTLSTASMDNTPSAASKEEDKAQRKSAIDRRKRSLSELLDPTQAVSVTQPPLLYLGFASIEEPRSSREIMSIVKNVSETSPTQKSVVLTHHGGCLTVSEGGEGRGKLLACPLYFVAQSTHSLTRGSSDCLGVSFSSGPYAKQCHVFRARNSREASDMVQVLQKAYRSASKQVEKVRKTSESKPSHHHHHRGHTPSASDKRGRGNAMEDEDVVIEHKPISSSLSRRESKRSIPLVRTSADLTSSVSSVTGGSPRASTASETAPLINPLSSPFGGPRPLGHTPSTPREGKRRGAKRSTSSGTGVRVSEREFTRQDKVDQLLNAIDRIVENSSHLRERCSKTDPLTIFEDALYAMHTVNSDLLLNYLSSRRVEANLCDSSGNSLLHYAVALGQPELVRILCKNKASLDQPGWNECRPIHRAVAEGNISILQVLLTAGANVNSLDIMRRTPLHMAAGKMELVECAISLMENGAQVMASDVLGLRPYDLNPEFKETQNRLVTSACETFASTILKEPGAIHSSPSATPPSSSSASSRPSSIVSGDHMRSHDPRPPSLSDEQLTTLLDKVQLRATVLARAYAQKSKFKKSMSILSKSFGNLAELKEVDEEELSRQLKLKFPSEFRLNSDYYELEGNASVIVKAMNELIQQAKKRKRRRGGPWLPLATPPSHQLELSFSEPDLLNPRSDEARVSPEPRPSSSAAVLEDNARLSKLRADSAASSTGTLVRDGEGSEVEQRLSAAFDSLEDDLRRGSYHKSEEEEEDEVQLSDALTHKLRLPHPMEADESPLLVSRTRSETDAIFNELISQMKEATDDLGIVVPVSTATESTNEVADAPVFSPPSDAPDDGADQQDTLKKKEKNSPKTKRIASPFKLRRKTVNHDRRKKPPPPLQQQQPVPSHNNGEVGGGGRRESGDVPHSRLAFKRKMSLPNIDVGASSSSSSSPPRPRGVLLSGGASSIELASHTTSNTSSLEALYSQFTSQHATSQTQTLLRRLPEPALLEPVTNALKIMVTLSSNKECLPTLISYLCLPKCVQRLISLSQSPHTSPEVLNNVAALMHNVFEGGGTSEGRKNALSSGVLDLTVKLLTSRDPIPGTCLSLLSNLLVSEDDNDYLRTIIRIPSAPLLLYLQPLPEAGCHDSGIDSRTVSMATRSSSDARATSDEGSSGIGMGPLSGGMGMGSSSLTSETSESGSARSLVSPTLKGHLVTHLEARRIVLKMLSVTSSHTKMQRELCTVGAVYLLSRCLTDPSQENVTNATITLANIAQHVDSHTLLTQAGLIDKLRSVLDSGPRPRFHAARALVYLGELGLRAVSLFEPTGYEVDTLLTTDEDDEHTYARGATIEKCVEYLTGDSSRLWGGFNLAVGPHPPTTPTSHAPPPKATKEQIFNFFLGIYKSFVHPLIFIRLLLHRLNDIHDPQNPFNWSNEDGVKPVPHTVSIPPTQMNVLNLFAKWLEAFPDDFTTTPQIQPVIMQVIERLKLAKGQFIPHTHRLKSLLLDTTRPRTSSLAGEETKRVPHHENLYNLCKQMVAGGHLPVPLEQALFLGALRLHVEEVLEPPFPANGVLGKSRRGFTFRLKQALPPGYTKSKSVIKRIRNLMMDFQKQSDRNAKHLFIERCQAMPGYDCTFFSVKVPSNARFKRSATSKQLLGISKKRIVFLDEKTKELVASHSLHTVVGISRDGDPCSLTIDLRGEPSSRVVVETSGSAREIANVLEQYREGEGLVPTEEDHVRWSDSLPSLFTVSMEPGEEGDFPSSPSTNENSLERPDTPPGPALSYDMLAKRGSDSVAWQQQTTPSHNATPPNGHLTGTMKMFAGDISMATDLPDQIVFPDDMVSFCNCPPDPEIAMETNLYHLSLTDVLRCPVELARQMTLISHERLCSISFVELLQKVNMIPKPSSSSSSSHRPSTSSSVAGGQLPPLSLSQLERGETAIERLALRFNQVGNWVAHSVLQYEDLEERTEVVEQFINVAQHCLDMHNFSTMMAIVVAGLGSAPIRRLQQTWGGVSKHHLELFKTMDGILDSRNNYKLYREKLGSMSTPAVPYIGVFLKDLTFICEGNPDYLRGGLINLHKRRQVYKKIEEIRHYQKEEFNFHKVPELQRYLLSHRLTSEDELHAMSHQVEPRIRRSHSNSTTRSSSTQNFFRALTRSGSSSSNLLRTT